MATQSDLRRERDLARRRRQPPLMPHLLTIGYDSDGNLGEIAPGTPLELTLEPTNADGELALWLDDDWWMKLFQRFGDEKLTIHMAPTPSCLLHMVVLYHLDMIYRVAPRWRVVAYTYRNDLRDAEAVTTLAKSAYHEVRFIDQDRPSTVRSDRCLMGVPLDELFGQIRREQTRLNRTTPVLVRVPPPEVSSEEKGPAPRSADRPVRTA